MENFSWQDPLPVITLVFNGQAPESRRYDTKVIPQHLMILHKACRTSGCAFLAIPRVPKPTNHDLAVSPQPHAHEPVGADLIRLDGDPPTSRVSGHAKFLCPGGMMDEPDFGQILL